MKRNIISDIFKKKMNPLYNTENLAMDTMDTMVEVLIVIMTTKFELMRDKLSPAKFESVE